jgi:hypothetical protein
MQERIWTDEELRIFELLKDRRYEEVVEACRDLAGNGNAAWVWLESVYAAAED